MYERQTIDRWDIMSNYGYAWECECSEYTYKDAKQILKEYRENGGGCYRLEKHREKRREQHETTVSATCRGHETRRNRPSQQ